MASWRPRPGGRFEFKVTRRALLPKPLYFTFDDLEQGKDYCHRLEQLLDQGIIPEGILQEKSEGMTLGRAIRKYLDMVAVKDDDQGLLGNIRLQQGAKKLSTLDYHWAEAWVAELKRTRNLAPSTIRHYVGALARCLDWAVRKGFLVSNPLRLLPRGYAAYTEKDAKHATPKKDIERDRRLEEEEEVNIRRVLAGGFTPEGKQRPLDLDHRLAMVLLFDLALETGMRLREIFTLSHRQVNLKKKTIFLEKTKNGDKRQVPLSSVAIKSLKGYFKNVPNEEQGRGELIFPWWNGEMTSKELNATTSLLSRRWGRVFDHAGCRDLRFHDLRHEATCRFYERTTLSDLQISRITGHKNLGMLRRYANLRGSDLAGQLW